MNARKVQYTADDLAALFDGAEEVVVAKGKKVLTFDPARDTDALFAEALGRSGTLRAPTLRVGKRFLVGYSDEAWTAFFD